MQLAVPEKQPFGRTPFSTTTQQLKGDDLPERKPRPAGLEILLSSKIHSYRRMYGIEEGLFLKFLFNRLILLCLSDTHATQMEKEAVSSQYTRNVCHVPRQP